MKRRTALRKVRTFCERLDALGEALPVRVLSVHIFGSVLTDKAAPADIDLLVEHQERPIMTEEEQEQVLADLWKHRPSPFARAMTILTRGLPMFRIVPYGYGSRAEPDPRWSAQRWAEEQMGKAVPMKALWKPGGDWRQVIAEIEQSPLEWDVAAEQERKEEIARRHPSTTARCPICNRRHSYPQNKQAISTCLEKAVQRVVPRGDREGLFFMAGPIPPRPVPSWPTAPDEVRAELTALRRRRSVLTRRLQALSGLHPVDWWELVEWWAQAGLPAVEVLAHEIEDRRQQAAPHVAEWRAEIQALEREIDQFNGDIEAILFQIVATKKSP